MLVENSVWLIQRKALGKEPSLSHGLMILFQTLWLGQGNLYSFTRIFVCVILT
jgi:hypothetical protein